MSTSPSLPTPIHSAFRDACVLFTGADGFVGSVLLESILRTLLDEIAVVYVLVRAKSQDEARDRLHSSIFASELFDVLLRGSDSERRLPQLEQKVIAVAADERASLVVDDRFRIEIIQRVDVVLHAGAVRDAQFDLRTSVAQHVQSTLRVLDLAKAMARVRLFVHMSTAFVNADQSGVLQERLPLLPGIDPEALVEHVLRMSAEKCQALTPRIIGRYPNVYTFTRAVIESLLARRRGSLPMLFVRPTLVGATYRAPFPGFVDTVDPFGAMLLYTGLGIVQAMQCEGDRQVNLVPADYVASTTLAAVWQYCDDREQERRALPPHMPPSAPPLRIVHVGSLPPPRGSNGNGEALSPLTWDRCRVYSVEYWKQHVPKRAVRQPQMQFYRSQLLYELWFYRTFTAPRRTAAAVASVVSTNANVEHAEQLWRTELAVREAIAAAAPFTRRHWRFALDNFERLLAAYSAATATPTSTSTTTTTTTTTAAAVAAEEGDKEEEARDPDFLLDVARIDWHTYICYYCYGIHRFVIREEGLQPPADLMMRSLLTRDTLSTEAQPWYQRLFADVIWAWSGYRDVRSVQVFRSVADMKRIIMQSDDVARVVDELCAAGADSIGQRAPSATGAIPRARSAPTRDEIVRRGEAIIERMAHTFNIDVTRFLGWFMRKVFRTIYTGIHIDEKGLAQLREACQRGPALLIPSHRSYVDFLIVSYMCYEYSVPLPHIAAGEDFLGIIFVNWLFRNAGAFFIRRSFKDDPLYWAIFSQYLSQMVEDRCPIEFFIEGTRSRSGKTLYPKLGMMAVLVEAYLRGKTDDVQIFPISISYEKVLEAELYSNELLGEKKIPESLQGLFRARRILKLDYGRINVNFSPPISLERYTAACVADAGGAARFDPRASRDDQRALVARLGFHVCGRLNHGIVVTATAIVSALMLVYRRGISRRDLVSFTGWLRDEITSRGATVAFEGPPSALVDYAFNLLRNLIANIRGDMIQPLTDGDQDNRTYVVLGTYRNQLLHLFFADAVVAIALNASSLDHNGDGVPEPQLVDAIHFVNSLFLLEFVTDPSPCPPSRFRDVLARLERKGHVERRDAAAAGGGGGGDARYHVTPSGEGENLFLCHLFWPFIESYWIAALTLMSLVPRGHADRGHLHRRMSWIAEEMWNSGEMPFFESCSMETLGNAINLFLKWRVLRKREHATGVDVILGAQNHIELVGEYAEGPALSALVTKIGHFRHGAAARTHHDIKAAVADFPVLMARM